MPQIVGYSTTVEIWNALNQIYYASSMARVIELHIKLQMLRKDGLSVGEYIQKLKSICNSLAAIGELVFEKDYLIYLFSGLDREYNPFVTSIQNQFDQPIIEQIHSLLLIYDFRLKQQNFFSLNSAQVHMSHLNKKPYKSTPQPTFNHIHIQLRYFHLPFKQSLVNINPTFWANHNHDSLNLNGNHIFQSRIKSLNAKFVVNLDTLLLYASITQI